MATRAAIAYTIVAPAPTAANHATAAEQRRKVDHAMRTVQRLLDRCEPDELEQLFSGVEHALAEPSQSPAQAHLVAELSGGNPIGATERAALELEGQLATFRRRRELLSGALTAPQVAHLLGTSRQTPHDRAKRGSLLAIYDRGMLRFPPWQFDPRSADGVLPGLPAVLRALRTSPLGKASWLIRSNPAIDASRPIDLLRAGEIDRVLRAAQVVGVS